MGTAKAAVGSRNLNWLGELFENVLVTSDSDSVSVVGSKEIVSVRR